MAYSIMAALFDERFTQYERCAALTDERKAIKEKIENEKLYFTDKMSFDDCQRYQELEELYAWRFRLIRAICTDK